jgi:CRP/FNR family transcriptional regulator, cyclic AMP receptor protein
MMAWTLPSIRSREGVNMLKTAGRDLDDENKEGGFSKASCKSWFDQSRISTIHPDGTLIFNEGQSPVGVYLVLGGSAKVSISSPQGKLLIIRVARAGEFLGINATMTGLPYQATAQAWRKCTTSFIPRAEFIALQQRDERLREQVQVALSRYVIELLGITRRLMLAETAAEKLASLLLRWCDEFGSVEPHGIRLVWEFTHEDVAQMICVSRETVTRLLGEFSKRGLVLLTGNSLLVSEPQGLEEIAAGRC